MTNFGKNRWFFVGTLVASAIAFILGIVAASTDVFDFDGAQGVGAMSPADAMNDLHGLDGNPAKLDSHIGYVFIGSIVTILISIGGMIASGIMLQRDVELNPKTIALTATLGGLSLILGIAAMVVHSDLNDIDWFIELMEDEMNNSYGYGNSWI